VTVTTLVLFEGRSKSEDGEDVVSYMREIIDDARCFEGCERLVVHRNQEDPRKFVAVESWRSRSLHEQYTRWRKERGELSHLLGLFETWQARYFDPLDF
jgi:quinol monooxygenase YgiN